MTNQNKSIILEIEAAKQELVNCVNTILVNHNLSCYLIEPVFAEMYSQIKTVAQNELAQARASIEQKEESAE